MWSEHIIRSALPGKPNLRSKLCQVRRSIMMTTIAMMMVMILFLMMICLSMTTTATRCTLRPNPGGVAGWLHGPLSMIQNLDRKWKKIFEAKPLFTFFCWSKHTYSMMQNWRMKGIWGRSKRFGFSSFYFCFKCCCSCIFMFSIWATQAS